MLPNRVVSIDEISDALETLLEDPMPDPIDKPETEETGRARMPDDMKTMAAILRLLAEHDEETANDIMEYVTRRAKRAAMLKETELRR